MSLRYCFEESKVLRTLNTSKPHDLAVIDTDGGISTAAIKAACARGVWVYGYINAGALERERSYYGKFKHLRIAKYEGWDGEYWIDVTADEWKEHIVALAKTIKATGAIGVYLDNTDIYYMARGFHNPMKKPPSQEAVYHALEDIVDAIQYDVGLIVMPNGGDNFVRRLVTEHPGIIQTINQEGLFYENFRKQSKEETEYRKSYMKWAAKRIKGKVRGIEYCKKPSEIAYVKAYYLAHGWDVYISKHKNLEGD